MSLLKTVNDETVHGSAVYMINTLQGMYISIVILPVDLRCDRNNEQKGKRDNDEEENFAAVNSYDPFDMLVGSGVC